MATPILSHRLKTQGKDRIPIPTFPFKVGYTDVFSMPQFYMLLREWFIEHGYVGRSDEDFPENFYLQRNTPNGREIWIRWRFVKEMPGTSGLWSYTIDADIHCLGLKEVEAMQDGKKVKADKGEVEVEVATAVVADYGKAWEKHAWLQHYKDFILYKYLKKKFQFHKKEVALEAARLQDAIKSYLRLPTYMPEKELPEFWGKRPG